MLALLPLLGPLLGRLADLIPDPNARARALQEAQTELLAALSQSDAGQAPVNAAEAAHPSLFVAGWRPAIGWVCVLGLLYEFIGRPIGSLWAPALPALGDDVWALVFGMLGLSAIRTVEKNRGIDTRNIAIQQRSR